jgi:hypothetical protein
MKVFLRIKQQSILCPLYKYSTTRPTLNQFTQLLLTFSMQQIYFSQSTLKSKGLRKLFQTLLQRHADSMSDPQYPHPISESRIEDMNRRYEDFETPQLHVFALILPLQTRRAFQRIGHWTFRGKS